MKTTYRIKCNRCGSETPEDVNQIFCSSCGRRALLTTVYSKALNVDTRFSNIYRYRDWLPVLAQYKELSSIPGCYQSRHLARELGLENLWILFSGYWPEMGATLESASFKEFEAIGVLSRAHERSCQVPLVCSAGNTGLSVLLISRRLGIPAIVVAPEPACREYSLPGKGHHDRCFLICLTNAAYRDCMEFVSELAKNLPGVFPAGGAYNIARRDFLSLPLIHGAFTMNGIPDHYFQAVGSGTGAIAAWEANARLNRVRMFTPKSIQLHLAQNNPFTPIVNLWENRTFDRDAAADKVLARVLTNPDPPYRVQGGVRDVLSASRGRVYGVSNHEILEAKSTFETLEGIDIQYPAAACVASLKQAVKKRLVSPEDSVFLHITGGGGLHLKQQKNLGSCSVDLIVDKTQIKTAVSGIEAFLAFLENPSRKRSNNERS